MIKGIINITRNGSGYVIIEGSKDIFVHSKNISTAMNGDEVRISLSKFKGRIEGKVIKIITRKTTKLIGVIDNVSGTSTYLTKTKQSINIKISPEDLNDANHDDKVLVEITKYNKNYEHFGKVINNFGQNLVNDSEMNAIMYEYGFDTEFEDEVLEEANKITFDITDEEISKRRDMRDTLTLTIDPETAKDFDDAISYKKLDNDLYEIGIHIADVTHYVKEDSLIEEEAYNRATSVYLVDRCVSMLPEHLSNGVCSLRPNEDKLAYSSIFEMDYQGNIKSEWYGRTVIHSDKRFSYESAQSSIDQIKGNKMKVFSDAEMAVHELNEMAKNIRASRGTLDFNRSEHKFVLDETGKPIGISLKESLETNKLIEEFMLLANKKVSKYLAKDPAVYRTHDNPNEEKLQEFTEFVTRFGYHMDIRNTDAIRESMAKLMTDIKGTKEEGLISSLAVRTMSKATYTTNNIGHYGLDFDYYTHFTSPIRRYPDMMVHRLLTKKLNGDTKYKKDLLETKCVHSSVKEINASKAERDSIKYKQAEYLQDKIGDRFEGVITGITNWGIFVELVDNKCEGLLRRDTLELNGFTVESEEFKISRADMNLTLGDLISVSVKEVDLMRKQIEFDI